MDMLQSNHNYGSDDKYRRAIEAILDAHLEALKEKSRQQVQRR